ncbi:MAG: flavin reductase family protein [Candidatus Izemoplasmataceae bacterium]
MHEFVTIEMRNLDKKAAHSLLLSAIAPRPVALVTTLGENQVMNGAPYSYFNLVSTRPPMVSVSISRREGAFKDTTKHIKATKVFTVNMVDEDNVESVHKTAKALPADESELEHFGLTPNTSAYIKAPGIDEAKVRLECRMKHIVPLEHKGVVTGDLVLGEIIAVHVEKSLYKHGAVDTVALKPVGRLGGDDYARLGEVFTIERDE